MLDSLKCFVAEKPSFSSTSVQIRKSVYMRSRALFLKYVVGQNRGYRIALSDATDKRTNAILLNSFLTNRPFFFTTHHDTAPIRSQMSRLTVLTLIRTCHWLWVPVGFLLPDWK